MLSETQRQQHVARRAMLGLLAAGLGCILAWYGSIRLGIGRHGDAWWRPFENPLTPAHVENLAVFALGIAEISIGAWVLVSAIRRATSRCRSSRVSQRR